MLKDKKINLSGVFRRVILFLGMVLSQITFANAEVKPSISIGADVFSSRCTLCHGSQGMGEGPLALKLEHYPNTNLLTGRKAQTREDIHEVITYGAALINVSRFMPPMGDDLTWTELESVVDFVVLLKTNPESAIAMLKEKNSSDFANDIWIGRDIYETRCALCHGKTGQGDGRMAKVIKSPPPFNLTLSRLPKNYLASIISKGGAAVQRSPQMPPWGDQLSEHEIQAVIQYIISLRVF